MRPIRNGLYAAGIPVENTKGEAEAGQEELNIKYAPALDTAEVSYDLQARGEGNCLGEGGAQRRSCRNGRATRLAPRLTCISRCSTRTAITSFAILTVNTECRR